MSYRRGWRTASLGLALAGCGIAGAHAWHEGMWGLLTGALLAGLWLAGLLWWSAARLPVRLPGTGLREIDADAAEVHAVMQRLLLDAAPTPLVAVEGGTVRVLNRAARRLFAADDRIIPAPAALLDPAATFLRHEGRQWRIDRVAAPGAGSGASVAALIDFQREERAAEARASAELIEILGHELLNGLAPIVSLAESAQTAASKAPVDPALMDKILGPLARRAEGLQRFASAYRALARLPEPDMRPVQLEQFAHDLARAFSGRWPAIDLALSVPSGIGWPMDRDQMHQAVWALLHNAAEATSGQDRLRVELAIAREGDKLAICVTDNGSGVPPENAAHIFRPFHTTKPEGSGIGLSLARQIASAHGGMLELTSANPTSFCLTLMA